MPQFKGEQVSLFQLDDPEAPAVTVQGTTGATTYTYVVVGKWNDAHTAASPETTVTTGNATLSSVNHNRITPVLLDSVRYYDIYRVVGGATQGKIGRLFPRIVDGVQVRYFRDMGQAGDGETAPDDNDTGQLLLDGVPVTPNGQPVLFTSTPTNVQLGATRLGVSFENGVLSLHVNVAGTIKTLSLGEPTA